MLDKNDITDILTVSLYRRILMSCPWYEILKMLNPQQLQNALSDKVIRTIFPKGLQERYAYAARILHIKRIP